VRRLLASELGLKNVSIVCACSGGPDSTAMLHVLAGLREPLGLALTACAVEHGIRPEAASEIAHAADVAASLRVPFEVVRLTVARGANLMARAREARYEALRAAGARAGAAFIATGHTADDRAETVVMRILRGAGPRGLAVLPPRAGDLLRPIVRARRAEVLRHLGRAGLTYATDPSNADVRFLRARVRGEVMPLLEALSPGVVESLCALADALGDLVPGDDPLASLGRRQREMIETALRAGKRSARVRTSDREEVLVRLENGRPILTKQMSPKAGPKRETPRKARP
jgi:tRNA(Ile)-lysidine synthase